MNNKEKGFVLLFALTILILTGLAMLILTQGSRALYVESQDAWGKLQAKNLALSAIAWVKENVTTGKANSFDKIVELDTTEAGIEKSKMTVMINNKAEVAITVSTSKGTRNYKINNTYPISDLTNVRNN